MEEHSIFQALLGTAGLYLYWLFYIATGIGSAYYVYQDSIKQDRRVLAIHPYWWAVMALIGGIWTMLAYWLMQHSSLAKTSNEQHPSLLNHCFELANTNRLHRSTGEFQAFGLDMHPILISACLLGNPVRYDGTHKRAENAILQRWLDEGRVVSVCPELAAGLSVPRPPAEISAGAGGESVIEGRAKVIGPDGNDFSAEFVAGANYALQLAQSKGIRIAVLKEASPSCGSGQIHDGTFSGTKLPGRGVTSALLERAGIRVFSEAQFAEAEEFLLALEARDSVQASARGA